jgi:hypothetical protein
MKHEKSNKIAGITTHFSILTLNVNVLNSPIQRRVGIKSKIQPFVAYRKHISLTKAKQQNPKIKTK